MSKNLPLPNLIGKIAPEAERAIIALYQTIGPVLPKISTLEGQVSNIMSPGKSVGTEDFLHQEDIKKIAHELSAAGSSPLNVGSLIGELSQPQKAMVTVNNTNGSGTPPTPVIPPANGSLTIQNGQLFYFDASVLPGVYKPVVTDAVLIFDTYANWTLANYNPVNYPPGTVFVVSDWNVIYWNQLVASVPTWVYLSGTFEKTYADLPTTGFDGGALGTSDSGLRFYDNSTYIRSWEWNGSTWKYASAELPGGDTSPAIMILAGNSVPPGWHVCDGSPVTITKSDATTVSFTTPNFNSGNYPKGGSYSTTIVPVVDPILNPITPAGSVSAPNFTGTPVPITSQNILISAGATTVLESLDGSTSSYTPHGTNNAPTFTGTPVTPTVSSHGEPEHIVIPYYIKL